jgi:hypothetical protein
MRKAIEFAPQVAAFRAVLGTILERQGRNEEALLNGRQAPTRDGDAQGKGAVVQLRARANERPAEKSPKRRPGGAGGTANWR